MISPTFQRFEPNAVHLYQHYSKRNPGPPVLRLGVRLSTLPNKNIRWEASKLGNNKDDPARIRIYKWECGTCCL
jgi:hypothetical protein